ncbi:MAG TPA: toprim domain-containing protein, partial [Thermoleophilaceae bacterium]|nr:toprim domain-containing protein [Thermoleophilaceae bacterium]
RQLFGIDRARSAAATAGRVVVVEGYTDVLALHEAGLEETVAIMGTALTQEQLAELHRAAGTVYLALDADRSGQEAMLRAGRAAASRGLELLVVPLPDGRDPAELVAEDGVEAFRSLLDSAISVVEFEVRRVIAQADLGSGRGRDRALERIRPLIASTGERSATRDELVRYVADRLDVPPAYLLTQLSVPAAAPRRPVPAGREGPGTAPRAAADREGAPRGEGPGARQGAREVEAVTPPSVEASVRAERAFLAMCVAEPAVGRRYLERLGDEHLSSAQLRRVRDHLVEHLQSPMSGLPDDDPALAALVGEVAMLADEEPSSEPALRLGFLQLELRRIQRGLVEARGLKDFARQRELLGAREEVRGRLSALMGETV